MPRRCLPSLLSRVFSGTAERKQTTVVVSNRKLSAHRSPASVSGWNLQHSGDCIHFINELLLPPQERAIPDSSLLPLTSWRSCPCISLRNAAVTSGDSR
jgi:hypothetical protein